MCGDALTGYKALSSSRDCSGESMFCFSCCVYKILPPFTDTVHEQLAQQALQSSGKTCNTASTYT